MPLDLFAFAGAVFVGSAARTASESGPFSFDSRSHTFPSRLGRGAIGRVSSEFLDACDLFGPQASKAYGAIVWARSDCFAGWGKGEDERRPLHRR